MIKTDLPHLEMILVEGAAFTMGDDKSEYDFEKPAHQVSLDSFYIGKYPVTQALWKVVMGADNNPSSFKGDNRPVEEVSWEDTQIFLEQLNAMTGKGYRLLSEAEWEFAARGGNENQSYFYSGSNKLKDVGWYSENSHGETKPIGLKYPNELGIYDMSGNVWEWCQDWFDENYYKKCFEKGMVHNPPGPDGGAFRVCRGGSWNFSAAFCRVTSRDWFGPRGRDFNLGFRLGLSLQATL